MPLDAGAPRARARALRHLLLALPRPDGRRARDGRPARIPPAAVLRTSTGCATAPVGYFFDVMTNGFGVMLDYAAQIPPADRWAIAAYVRALQLSQSATLADVPADEPRPLESPTRPEAAPLPVGADDWTQAIEIAKTSARRRGTLMDALERPAPAGAPAGFAARARRRRRRARRLRGRRVRRPDAVLPLVPARLRLLDRPRGRLARRPHAPVPDGRRVGHRDPARARGGDAHAAADCALLFLPIALRHAPRSTSGRTPDVVATTSSSRRRRST